jgi:hypothetical protein
MVGTASRVFGVETVRTVQPCDGASVVTFQSGLAARVPPDHPDWERILREAERSLGRRSPVGVLVSGDGRLLELSPTHETGVRSVREDVEDKGRVAVWFWAYSPVCYLTRDHPEFDRIRATLEQAAASGSRVYLANRMRPVEGEAEIWWEILDVRPIKSLPAGA